MTLKPFRALFRKEKTTCHYSLFMRSPVSFKEVMDGGAGLRPSNPFLSVVDRWSEQNASIHRGGETVVAFKPSAVQNNDILHFEQMIRGTDCLTCTGT